MYSLPTPSDDRGPSVSSYLCGSNYQLDQLEKGIPYSSDITKISMLQSELSARGKEIESLRFSLQEHKIQSEKIIRDLLRTSSTFEERVKVLEVQQENNRSEINRYEDENARLRQQVDEYRRQAEGRTNIEDAQTVQLRTLHRQVLRENEDLQLRNSVLLKENEQIQGKYDREVELHEDLKATHEEAVDKLYKASQHIKILSDEATETRIQLLKNVQCTEEAVENKRLTQAVHGEVHQRMCRAVYALAEEVEEIVLDADELSLRTRLALKGQAADDKGNIDEVNSAEIKNIKRLLQRLAATRRRPTKPADLLLGHGDAVDDQPPPPPPPRSLPNGVYCLYDLSQASEGALITTASNILDFLALARDDLALTIRAIEEEGLMRRQTSTKHFVSLQEAVEAEREETKSLLQKIRVLNTEKMAAEEEISKLKNTLRSMDTMMSEAEELSRERSKRLEQLISENDILNKGIIDYKSQVTEMTNKLAASGTQLVEVQNEMAQLKWLSDQRAKDFQRANEEASRCRNDTEEANDTIKRLNEKLREKDRTIEEYNGQYIRLDGEMTTLRKQLKDREVTIRQKDRELSTAGETCRDLGDQVHHHRKTLDSVLRTGSVTPIGRGMMATPVVTAASGGPLQMSALQCQISSSNNILVTPTSTGIDGRLLHFSPDGRKDGGGGALSRSPGVSRIGACETAGVADGVEASHDKVAAWENRINGLLKKAHSNRSVS